MVHLAVEIRECAGVTLCDRFIAADISLAAQAIVETVSYSECVDSGE